MTVFEIIATVLIGGGLFFFLVGGIGLVKFPDFFTRLHPAGKADTLGATLLLLGLAVYQGFSLLTLKILLVEVFIFLANPAATHAIGRAAYKRGLVPWTGDRKEDRR